MTADPKAVPSCGLVVTAIDLPPQRWSDLGAFFATVEEVGCDTIWLTDHLFAGHPCADPLVLSAIAAGSTSSCAIGTGVLQIALRRSAAIAKAASTLQLVSGGRFRLGVGVGQHLQEFQRAGIDYAGRGESVDRMLRDLGEHWTLGDGWYQMRPSSPAPIWVGGTSEPALRRTATFAEGWLSLFQSPDRFAAANVRLDELLSANGRGREAVERRMLVFGCPTDPGWTRNDALEWIARQFPAGKRGVERHVVTGSTDECVERIRAYLTNGADGVDLQITHPDPVSRFAALREALVA